MTFRDQVAVITGASSGIGRSLALALAAEGSKVGLVARREGQLAELAEEIRRAGGTAAFAAADVADRGRTLAAFESLRATLGQADLLIANAGVGTHDAARPAQRPRGGGDAAGQSLRGAVQH